MSQRNAGWARLVAVIVLACLALPASAEGPRPFEAVYKLSAKGFTIGEGRVTLAVDGDGYAYRRTVEPRGLVALFRDDRMEESSAGRLVDGRPRPARYHFLHDKKGEEDDREERMRFDAGVATGRYKDKRYRLELPAPQTQDRLSQELLLMAAAAAGERSLDVPVVERGKLKTYRFRFDGKATVKVPAGTFETLRMRVDRRESDRRTRLWLAPALGYIPVKITHQEPGDDFTVVSRLKSIQR